MVETDLIYFCFVPKRRIVIIQKMKNKINYILLFIFGLLLFSQVTSAQVDSNAKPDDDLGNVTDEFQELFYEALQQKAIENYDKAIVGASEGEAVA